MIELPSLHTLDQAQAARIWLATQATDMRCGFDRLAKRVLAVTNQDPLSDHPADKARTQTAPPQTTCTRTG
jgi:transposase